MNSNLLDVSLSFITRNLNTRFLDYPARTGIRFYRGLQKRERCIPTQLSMPRGYCGNYGWWNKLYNDKIRSDQLFLLSY